MNSKTLSILVSVVLCAPVSWGANWLKLEVAGTYSNASEMNKLLVCGNQVYALWHHHGEGATRGGISKFDISDPENPKPIGRISRFGTHGYPTAIQKFGDYVLVGFSFVEPGEDALMIIDMTGRPKILGGCSFGDGGEVFKMCVVDDLCYVPYCKKRYGGQLFVVSLADPTAPKIIGEYAHDDELCSVTVVDQMAYVGSFRDNELIVLDVSHPWSPKEIQRLPLEGAVSTTQLCQDGSAIFATSGGPGRPLTVIDVSDPACASQTGQVLCPLTGGFSSAVCTCDSYAFLSMTAYGMQAGGLEVLDVSDPSAPVHIGCFPSDVGFLDVQVADGKPVVAAGNRGLMVFNVTELPSITRQSVENGKLVIEWNDAARGMTLQRATSLEPADWQDLNGSKELQRVELPMWHSREYFRLVPH